MVAADSNGRAPREEEPGGRIARTSERAVGAAQIHRVIIVIATVDGLDQRAAGGVPPADDVDGDGAIPDYSARGCGKVLGS